MKNLFTRFVREESGQDLTEYAMLVALIAFVCIVTVTAFGVDLAAYWGRLSAEVTTWAL